MFSPLLTQQELSANDSDELNDASEVLFAKTTDQWVSANIRSSKIWSEIWLIYSFILCCPGKHTNLNYMVISQLIFFGSIDIQLSNLRHMKVFIYKYNFFQHTCIEIFQLWGFEMAL